MIDRTWYEDYIARYRDALFSHDVFDECISLRELAINVRTNGGKLMIAGNGASAAIASHVAGDFTKQAKVPAVTFHDPDLITMMANDYGYENWVSESVQAYARPNDALILISSSGRSPNIVNAAKSGKDLGLPVVAFSGFNRDNPLAEASTLSFWVNSKAYNVIENTHSIWLTTAIDMIIGKAEYEVTK